MRNQSQACLFPPPPAPPSSLPDLPGPPDPRKQRQDMLNTESHLRKAKGDLNPEHLRLKVLPEAFGKGIVVDFQLSDLERGNNIP